MDHIVMIVMIKSNVSTLGWYAKEGYRYILHIERENNINSIRLLALD